MARPGTSRAAKIEIEARRRKVARLYARKLHQDEIAQMLGVSQPTVSRDVTAIEAAWRTAAIADIADARARELAELQDMERRIEQDLAACDKGDHAAKRGYYAERRQVKARIAALLGLDAPVRAPVDGDGKPVPAVVVREVVMIHPERDDDESSDGGSA